MPSPKNPEIIHRIRVSARRLRILLKLCGSLFPAEAAHRWRKEIRRYTRTLGNAREYDCLLEFLDALPTKKPFSRQKESIQALSQYFKKKESQIYFQIKKDAASFKIKKVPQQIKDSLQINGHQKISFKKLSIRKKIKKSAKRVLRALQYAESTPEGKALHFLRIEIKKIRYSLEIAAHLQTSGLWKTITICAEYQNLLGKIRDMHVWNKQTENAFTYLIQQECQESGNSPLYQKLTVGQDVFRCYFKKKRRQLYKKAMKHLKKLPERIRPLVINDKN